MSMNVLMSIDEQDTWIVELLINDLIDWHDWFATYR